MKCTAKAKSTQKRCTRWAMKGTTVCYVHGGPTPRGIASPNFKTGRYTKEIPDRLVEKYQESISDPDLLALSAEISLVDARLSDLLSRVDTGESGALWKQAQAAFIDFRSANAAGDQDKMTSALSELNRILNLGVDDYKAWREVGDVIEQRRKLVESERKRRTEMESMITAERQMLLIAGILGVIRENVTDKTTLSNLSTGIRALISPVAERRIES